MNSSAQSKTVHRPEWGGRDRRERQRADAERVENGRRRGRPLWTPVGEGTRGNKDLRTNYLFSGFREN
jgi:hypothetical protein